MVLSGFLSFYSRCSLSRPIATKSVTAASLMFVGDLLSQKLEGKDLRKEFDTVRSARMTLYALFITGPLLHFWYRLLVRMFGTKLDTRTALKQLAFDQAIAAPSFLFLFLMVTGTADGIADSSVGVGRGVELLRTSFVPILMTNYSTWPFINFAAFRYVPEQFRVLYNGVRASCLLLLAYSFSSFEPVPAPQRLVESSPS